MTPSILALPDGRRIAYHVTPGTGPTLAFLGGFVSDMTGTKALFLEDWAKARGRAFLRFDYTGHGASSGAFEEGCIGDWADDAAATIARLTEGPVVLAGSSMGGWISLLLARRMPDRVAGLVGIAAAPDFTEDGMWAAFSEAQRQEIMGTGRLVIPSAYAPEGYRITRRLIEDGRRHLVLRARLPLPFPVRLIHGTADADVPVSVALRLFEVAEGPDIRLTLVKGAGHRLSEPAELALIARAAEEVSGG
jgi:pimeloyl-ACP methyl ester carboxylesterase